MPTTFSAPALLEPVRDRERIRLALAGGGRLVACLCAGWCSSCAAWHDTFAELAQASANDCFVWIDIEDHAALIADVEVETLPVLLVQPAHAGPGFLGPIEPRAAMLRALLERAQPQGSALDDPGIRHALADGAPDH